MTTKLISCVAVVASPAAVTCRRHARRPLGAIPIRRARSRPVPARRVKTVVVTIVVAHALRARRIAKIAVHRGIVNVAVRHAAMLRVVIDPLAIVRAATSIVVQLRRAATDRSRRAIANAVARRVTATARAPRRRVAMLAAVRPNAVMALQAATSSVRSVALTLVVPTGATNGHAIQSSLRPSLGTIAARQTVQVAPLQTVRRVKPATTIVHQVAVAPKDVAPTHADPTAVHPTARTIPVIAPAAATVPARQPAPATSRSKLHKPGGTFFGAALIR